MPVTMAQYRHLLAYQSENMCEEERKDYPVRKLGHEDRRLLSIDVGTDWLQYQACKDTTSGQVQMRVVNHELKMRLGSGD